MTVARTLVQALQPALSELGMRWEAEYEWFRRRADGVQHMLQLLFVDHPPYVHIEPQLMVRHDLVEAIFHRTSGYQPEFQADTPTMGGDLNELITGAPARWEIGPDGDVTAAVRRMTGMLGQFEDYWRRMSDVDAIDDDLNSDPSRYSANRPLPWLRCSTGLIVARLVQRPRYAELEAEYSGQLAADNNGFYLSRFAALAADLTSHTPAELRSGIVRGDNDHA